LFGRGSYNRDCGDGPQLKLNGAEADLTIVLNLVTIPLHMLGQTICTIR
jgi:hypothetical protein